MKPEHTLTLYKIDCSKYPDRQAHVSALNYTGQVTSEKVDAKIPEDSDIFVTQTHNGQFELRWDESFKNPCDVSFYVYTASGAQHLTLKVIPEHT